MFKKFLSVFKNLNQALKLYYLPILFSIALAWISLSGNAEALRHPSSKEALTLSFILGINLSFGFAFLAQRVGRLWLWNLLSLVLIGAYYSILPKQSLDFEDYHIHVLVAPVFIMSILFVSIAAYLNRESKEIKFWNFNVELLIFSLIVPAFCLIFIGGLQLALLSIENLFDLHISGDLYWNLFKVTITFGITLVFSLFVAPGVKNIETYKGYAPVLKFLILYVLIPLLLAYLAILISYELKILFTWTLPRGFVSYIVLAYASVGTLIYLLVYPLNEKKSFFLWFKKGFFYSLLPLLALQFAAIIYRIKSYGFTELRYYVLFLALWFLGIALYFIFNKKASILWIPKSLLIAGIFILIVPYFNVFSLSVRSQAKEFYTLLEENELLENSEIQYDKTISGDLLRELNDKFFYLRDRDQLHKLEDITNLPTIESAKNFKAYFKNVEWEEDKPIEKYFGYYRLELDQNLIAVEDYDYILAFRNENKNFSIGEDSFELKRRVKYNDLGMYLILNGEENNLGKLFNESFVYKKIDEEVLQVQPLVIEIDKYKMQLVFDSYDIRYDLEEEEFLFYYGFEGSLLIKKLEE